MNYGFQLLLAFLSETAAGDGLLTRLTFLSFPFHFWFTGQFLPLWFILLCVVFNLYIDRVTERHSRKRDRTYE
jgi:putative solute:sodium symporter small subunit